ncbi:hypothetical protein FRC20_002322 [Serendipita sp. 405]|nr:hypothetical protein FRC20_002322 [Serendipita sp. 405]
MYIRSLKSAISTILEYEAFLLSDAEIKYIETLDVMPVHALYLLVRLSLRSHRWHRHSDFARYADDFDDASKLGDAYQILCNRRSPTVLKQQILKPEHNETQEGGSLNTAIDLTLDSDEEDLLTTKSISTHSSPGDYCLESSTSTLDLTFHATSEEHAELADLLGMLSKEELEDLARKIKLPGHGKKGNIITALLSAADTQYTLSHFRRNEYVTGNKGTTITFGARLRALCMGQIGCCIRINPAVLTLLRRINLIFFRTPVYEGHLFVPAILVASHKRVYHRYITTRTPDIFPDRCSLLEYEVSLELERGCEASVEDYKQLTSTKDLSTKERQAVEETILEFYRRVLDCFKVSLERRTRSQSLLGRVLERFEPGHVYTRTLHHIAPIVGKIDGVESETTILQSLLAQNRWHCGKRGGWYDRLALLHMKDKTTEQLRRAYKLVTVALLDESTLLSMCWGDEICGLTEYLNAFQDTSLSSSEDSSAWSIN